MNQVHSVLDRRVCTNVSLFYPKRSERFLREKKRHFPLSVLFAVRPTCFYRACVYYCAFSLKFAQILRQNMIAISLVKSFIFLMCIKCFLLRCLVNWRSTARKRIDERKTMKSFQDELMNKKVSEHVIFPLRGNCFRSVKKLDSNRKHFV